MDNMASTNTSNVIKTKRPKLRASIPIYLLLAPGILLLFVFHYIPIYGVVIAFQKYNLFKGVFQSPWVGLDNFKYILSDDNFWRVFRNTIMINAGHLLIGFPVPIIFSLLLNEVTSIKFKKFTQTVSYLPHFISWVVVAGIFTSILSPTNGLVNVLLNSLFGTEAIHFLAKQEYFRAIIIIVTIWKGFGMTSVYYISTLTSIDPQLYEAAHIDGAGKWKQMLHITLPGLKNIAIILLVLNVGNLVTNGFEQVMLLYNPVVYDVGDILGTYTYRMGIEQGSYSITTTIGLTQSIINFVLVYSANLFSKKVAGYGLW